MNIKNFKKFAKKPCNFQKSRVMTTEYGVK